MPNTGPSDASRRQSATFFPRWPSPCVTETEVVVLPSPAFVGVIAVTLISFPSGRSARRSSTSSETFALYLPYGSISSGRRPAASAISVMGRRLACCAISSDEGIVADKGGPFTRGCLIYLDGECNPLSAPGRSWVVRRPCVLRDPGADRHARAAARRGRPGARADRATGDRAHPGAGGAAPARTGAPRRGLPAPRDVRDEGRRAGSGPPVRGAGGARARGGAAGCRARHAGGSCRVARGSGGARQWPQAGPTSADRPRRADPPRDLPREPQPVPGRDARAVLRP